MLRSLSIVLLTIPAMTAGTGVARAGIVVSSATIMQVGDPHYEYDFQLTLQPGSQLRFGDFISIYDLKGVDATSFTNQPPGLYTFIPSLLGSGIMGGPAYPPGVNQGTVNDSATVYNATWEYISLTNLPPGGVTNVPLALGEFKIRTAPGSFGDLPKPPIGTLYYASQTHDANGNAVGNVGTITLTLVPEPASITMVATGAGLGLLALSRRHRSRA